MAAALLLAASLPHRSARVARNQEQLMHDLGSYPRFNEQVKGITEPSTHITIMDVEQLMHSQLSCLVAEPCPDLDNLDSCASDAARSNMYAERRPGSYISVEVSQDFSGDGHAGPEGRPCEAARVSNADDALACDEGWVPCELVVGLADAGSLLLEDVWQQGRLCDAVKQQLGCSCCIVSRHLQMHDGDARWEGVGKSRER